MANKTKRILFFVFICLLAVGCSTTEGKIKIGMTQEEVKSILGAPDMVNTSKDSKYLDRNETAWHYNKMIYAPLGPFRAVYFKGGKVSEYNEFYK